MAQFALLLAATLLCALAAHAAPQCEIPFKIQTADTMKVENCGGGDGGPCCFHYTCPGLKVFNQRSTVRMAHNAGVNGLALSFDIDVRSIEDTREVKLGFFRYETRGRELHALVLHYLTHYGNPSFTWQSWDWENGFVDIGPSKIMPGSGKHFITIVAQEDGWDILEDGHNVGRYDMRLDIVEPCFDVQAWSSGAKFDIEISAINFKPGARAPTKYQTS